MADSRNGKGGFNAFAQHEKDAANGVTPIGITKDAKISPIVAAPKPAVTPLSTTPDVKRPAKP